MHIKRLMTTVLAGLISLAGMVSMAGAVEPGWYGPLDGSGQGLFVRCNDADECGVVWLTYTDEQVWLIGTDTCSRADTFCEQDMALTEGSWMGRLGDAGIGDPVVFVELEQTADSLLVDFDARALLSDLCPPGLGVGGVLLNQCVGVAEFFLIAR